VVPFLERLKRGDVLLCDGAMGTMLQAAGLEPGECPELWCLDHSEAVAQVHREYREAGSDIVETNSFGASLFKLRHYGLEERAHEINLAAVSLAREVAGRDQYVLASAGPTGEFLAPLGLVSEEEMYESFALQARAFAEGGADAVILETMTALDELAVAIRAVREQTDLAVVSSFTFEPRQGGGYASMMGVSPAEYARHAAAAGAHVLGTNCGTGAEHMVSVVALLHDAVPGIPVMAMPNAGMPVLENGVTVFRQTPDQMAARTRDLLEAGAQIVGGCCGTTPAHVSAMRAVLNADR
jgi:5-methyltetrahydrofolate--homocysteine methyltransferase